MEKVIKNIGCLPVKLYPNAEVLKKEIFSDNKHLSGIYRWINEETGDSYIGSGKDLAKRIRNYFQISELEKNPRHINRALLKYGHEKFKLEILEYCDYDKLIEREQFYLDQLSPSYNILKQAYSLKGFKHSAETIDDLKNREFTQGHKDNLSKANTGRVFSKETLNKLSQSMKDYHKNNPLTPEALENIKQKTTEREGVPVALINQDTKQEIEFSTQTEAGKYLGISRQAVKNALDRQGVLAELYKVKRINIDKTNVEHVFTDNPNKQPNNVDCMQEISSLFDNLA